MALTPLAVHDLTAAVLECVCTALNAVAVQVEGQPGCPCRSCIVPGRAAFDSCEDPCGGGPGGQLSVNLVRIFPTSPFPEEDRSVSDARCKPPATTAAELAVTLLRCAPGPTPDGCPPSCDELEAAAQVLHVDAVTVLNALYCCLPGDPPPGRRGRKFVVGPQQVLGPEGGCVGLEQRVTVALPGCGVCPDDAS